MVTQALVKPTIKTAIAKIADRLTSPQTYNPAVQTPASNHWTTPRSSTGKAIPASHKDIVRAYQYAHAGYQMALRCTSQTAMVTIDLDWHDGSVNDFHPWGDRHHLVELALSSIGINRYFLMRSSASGGVHVVAPLPETVPSFKLACALHHAFMSVGIAPKPGQCELFPNTKAYEAEYNAVRMPLNHPDSCLLDENGDPFGDREFGLLYLADHWDEFAECQDMELLDAAIAIAEKPRRMPVCDSKELLEAANAPYWEKGMTNQWGMGKAIELRNAGKSPAQAAQAIVQEARQTPGFYQNCRHVHEIGRRAWEWVKWAYKGVRKLLPQPMREDKSWVNDVRQQGGHDRMLRGVKWARGKIWKSANQCIKAIAQKFGISPNTIRLRYMPMIERIMEVSDLIKAGKSARNDKVKDTEKQTGKEIESVRNNSDQTSPISVWPPIGSDSDSLACVSDLEKPPLEAFIHPPPSIDRSSGLRETHYLTDCVYNYGNSFTERDYGTDQTLCKPAPTTQLANHPRF